MTTPNTVADETGGVGFPAVRTPVDGLQDLYSQEAGQDVGTDTPTRQEFKDEADINILLARFGVTTEQQRPMTWGQEIDYNIDLQGALALIAQARSVEAQIPPELRSKYPTWRHMVNGIESGMYGDDIAALRAEQKAKEKEKVTETTSATPVT